ncbi:MAG: hypothetical protein MUD15_03440 [Desulfobacterota bacterium]|nr:hypothetical protein [Thermodesulfobacteriota bacterium]
MKTLSRATYNFLFLLILCSGCSSFQNYTIQAETARASIMSGDYQAALTVFPEKSAEGGNEILVRLERGTILQSQGLFEQSSLEFGKTAERIREYDDKAVISVTRTAAQAGSLLINEQVMPYEGKDFEKIMLHTLNAVNYLMRGDLEGARVEVRKAYEMQEFLSARHEKALEEARKEVGLSGWERSFEEADMQGYERLKEKASAVVSVYHNAFASYVSALVYELNGEPDEAYIDLKKAYQAYPYCRSIQRDLVRLSAKMGFREDMDRWEAMFGKLESVPQGSVDVYVLFSHGLAPLKEPLTLPIPIHKGFVFASLPVYRFTPSMVSGALVSAGNTQEETSTVCDIDAIAARNLLDEFPILFLKQIARSYLKAQAVGGMAREHGDAGALWGIFLAALTERADLRTWSTLPKQIQAARLFVPPAVTEISIQAFPAAQPVTVTIPEDARHVIVLCRYTEAGLCIHTKSY